MLTLHPYELSLQREVQPRLAALAFPAVLELHGAAVGLRYLPAERQPDS